MFVVSLAATARRQVEHCLGRIVLGGMKAISVQFQEEHAGKKASTLVSIDEGMIPYNSGCVSRSQRHNIDRFRVCKVLSWTSKSRSQQCIVPHSGSSAMCKQAPPVQF